MIGGSWGVAAIFGGVGVARANRGEADNKSHAVAGLATGLIALLIAAAIGVRIGTFVNDHQGDFRAFGDASCRLQPRLSRTTVARSSPGVLRNRFVGFVAAGWFRRAGPSGCSDWGSP